MYPLVGRKITQTENFGSNGWPVATQVHKYFWYLLLDYHYQHTYYPFVEKKIGALIRSCLYQVSNSASLHLILSYIGTKVGIDSDFTLRPKMGENCHKRHLHKISYSFDIILLHSVELFYIWAAQTNSEFSRIFNQSDSRLIG